MKTFEIQVLFGSMWHTLATGFPSKGDGEWTVGLWKQQNQCFGDPFRVVPETVQEPKLKE